MNSQSIMQNSDLLTYYKNVNGKVYCCEKTKEEKRNLHNSAHVAKDGWQAL